MHQSEVRLLLQRITSEYEAARQAVHGLSLGTARHAFINERLERMAAYHEQLSKRVGQAEAARLVCEQMAAEAH